MYLNIILKIMKKHVDLLFRASVLAVWQTSFKYSSAHWD